MHVGGPHSSPAIRRCSWVSTFCIKSNAAIKPFFSWQQSDKELRHSKCLIIIIFRLIRGQFDHHNGRIITPTADTKPKLLRWYYYYLNPIVSSSAAPPPRGGINFWCCLAQIEEKRKAAQFLIPIVSQSVWCCFYPPTTIPDDTFLLRALSLSLISIRNRSGEEQFGAWNLTNTNFRICPIVLLGLFLSPVGCWWDWQWCFLFR